MPNNHGGNNIADRLDLRSIVLVGMMGAGKTTVGRRLAARLGLSFVDVDSEIEKAAGLKIEDIFSEYGEQHFRDGEQRVIERLLRESPGVLATGGGAFMNAKTRKAVADNGVSVWLKADLDVLFSRVKRRNHRPLLKTANPEQVLRALLEKRTPFYAYADITIESRDVAHEVVVKEIVDAIDTWLN